MAPSTSNPRVLQLPKFAVVDVMIGLNGRECLASDKWEIKSAFWNAVLYRLNEQYPENVSEVRTINHVKRTWSALRQRVLQRFQQSDREILPSDLRVLYLLGEVDSYEGDNTMVERPGITCEVSQQRSLNNLFGSNQNYDDSLFEESIPSNYVSPNTPEPEPFNFKQIRPEPKQQIKNKSAKKELQEQLIRCRIEREKAKTELLKAQRRLVEAQLRNMDKNGGVDLLLSISDTFKN
ncbi:hypothetical protein M3Y97_00968200 [Aphelenchoides bicaudatus]|nr:hypothetical protein M3Y97_00968200 [Aphelenchoides bicaudatus]